MCVYFNLILHQVQYFMPCIDEDRHGTTRKKHEGDGDFRQVFFGRLVRSSKRLRESVL